MTSQVLGLGLGLAGHVLDSITTSRSQVFNCLNSRRFAVAVTRSSRSTQLPYIEPGLFCSFVCLLGV